MMVGMNISKAFNRASVHVLCTMYLESSPGECDGVLGSKIHMKEGRRPLESVFGGTEEGRAYAIRQP